MPKVTLTNTGTAPFVVTDAEGKFVEIPAAPPEAQKAAAPYPPADEQGRRLTEDQLKAMGGDKPANEVEVDLPDALVAALQQRQKGGSPLHVGGGGSAKQPGHAEQPGAHAQQPGQHAQTEQHKPANKH